MTNWTPSLHPRGAHGRFVRKGGSSSREYKTRVALTVGVGVVKAAPGVRLVALGNPVALAIGTAHIGAVGAETANSIHHINRTYGKRRIRDTKALRAHNAAYNKRAKVLRRTVATTGVVSAVAGSAAGRQLGAGAKLGIQHRAAAKNAARASARPALARTSHVLTGARTRRGAYVITSAGRRLR